MAFPISNDESDTEHINDTLGQSYCALLFTIYLLGHLVTKLIHRSYNASSLIIQKLMNFE